MDRLKYKVYTLLQRQDGTAAFEAIAETNPEKIADVALAEAAARLGPGLFALMIYDGKLHKVERGIK